MPKILRRALLFLACLAAFVAAGEFWLIKRGYDLDTTLDLIDRAGVEERFYREERASYPDDGKRPYRALVVGCSYTYGLGVEPPQTYVWKLNELFPDCYFENGGIDGGGPFFSFQRLAQRLSQRHYDLVIYSCIANHIDRNPNSYFRMAHSLSSEPCAWKETYDERHIYPFWYANSWDQALITHYRPAWKGDKTLRLINWLRTVYYDVYYARIWQYERFSHMIRAMYSLARSQNVKFGVAALYGFSRAPQDCRPYPCPLERITEPIEYFTQRPLSADDSAVNIPTLNAAYPREHQNTDGLHTPARTLTIHSLHQNCDIHIHDGGDHPMPIVHEHYAQRIAEWIKKEHLLPSKNRN